MNLTSFIHESYLFPSVSDISRRENEASFGVVDLGPDEVWNLESTPLDVHHPLAPTWILQQGAYLPVELQGAQKDYVIALKHVIV